MFDEVLKDIDSCNLIYFINTQIINNTLQLRADRGSDVCKIRELVTINELVNPNHFDMHFLDDTILIEKNIA